MANKHVSLADGGNEFASPGSPIGASATGYINVRPAEHHLRRHYSIEKQINTGARPFIGTEGDVLELIGNADTFDTHLIGAPALITAISLHVRSGLDISAGGPNVGATSRLTPYLEDQNDSSVQVQFVDPVSGAPAVIDLGFTGKTDKVYYFKPAVVAAAKSIEVPSDDPDEPPTVVELPPQFLGEYLNSNRVFKLMFRHESTAPTAAPAGTAAPDLEGCFNVVAYYTWLENDGPCDCVPKNCPSQYPDPECTPRV